MVSFRVRIVLCCVPAFVAIGCNSNDPCAGVTCDPNEVCVNGACAECAGEEDCNDQDACTTDTCGGQICLNAPISCNTAADCPAGCNVSCGILSFCSNSIDPCASCGPDEFCIFGPLGAACVECLNDADCDDDEVCDSPNGDCVECVSDGHCDGGEVCDEATNTCVGCDFNDECNDNNACTKDSCSDKRCFNEIIFCLDADECPAGCNVCAIDGICSN